MIRKLSLLCGGSLLSLLLPILLHADDLRWPQSAVASDGVLWFWEHGRAGGEILDAEGNPLRNSEGLFRGPSRMSWFLGLRPAGGFLEAADAGPELAQALIQTPSLHLEMVLHPPAEGPAQGLLFWIGDFGDDLTWQLQIAEGRLLLQRAGEAVTDLGAAPLEAPRHLAVSLSPTEIRVRWDGGEAQTLAQNRMPVIADEWDVVLTFGGAPGAENSWTGDLERLLISTAAGAPEAHAAHWRAAQAQREPPAVLSVLAEVSAIPAQPDVEALLEYHNALMATVWTLVEGALPGVAAGETFVSWHWYSLDRQVAQEPEPVGTRRRLHLSAAEQHPQLEGVQQITEPLDPTDLLLLTEWYQLRSVAP